MEDNSPDPFPKEVYSCVEFSGTRYTISVRIREEKLEIAMEQESDCIFWRSQFPADFIANLTEKTGGKMSVEQVFDYFESGLDNLLGDTKVTFDWLSPMDLVFMSNENLREAK